MSNVSIPEGVNLAILHEFDIVGFRCHILAMKSATGGVMFPNVLKVLQYFFLLPVLNVIAEPHFQCYKGSEN
jgi:hypothetical protein